MNKELNEIYVGFKDEKPYRRQYKKMIYFNEEQANKEIYEYAKRDLYTNKGWDNLNLDEREKLIQKYIIDHYEIKTYKLK